MDPREYILTHLPGTAFNSSGQIHTRCPFHEDNSPSFSIREDGVFVCGSPRCGIRGSFAYFYKLTEKIESWAKVYRDLKLTTVTPDLEELFAEKKGKEKEYWISPFPQPPQVEPIRSIQYLVDRGLGPDIVSRYGLLYGACGSSAGLSISDSIIVPVFDLNKAYVTFQVRYLSPSAPRRWQMPLGSAAQNILYGGWLIDSSTRHLWIVEGASDVWRLASFGTQAVGIFTTKTSPAQLNRLMDLCRDCSLIPVVCMDGDARFTRRDGKEVDCGLTIVHELQAFGLDPQVVYLEKTEDPGSLSRERFDEISGGLA